MARVLLNALARGAEYVSSLSDSDRLILNGLKPQKLQFDKNTVVFREGEPANHFLLVERGVCFSHRHLENGSRQIIDLYFPGEVVALGELSKFHHTSGLMTLSDTVLAAYDKTRITRNFSRSPVLSRLFIDMISQEQANLTDRLVGLTRYNARQRIAYFLLEIRFRANRARQLQPGLRRGVGAKRLIPKPALWPPNMVRIPQVLIADSLGLSIVHVNRVLRQLRQQGCIATCGQGIVLLDVEALEAIAEWCSPEPVPASLQSNG